MFRNIIDAHCHIYPDKIAPKAVTSVEDFYPSLPHDDYDGTFKTLLRTGNKNGVTGFIVHSVSTNPHQVQSINDFISRSVRESNGAFLGLGTIHPDSESKYEVLEYIVKSGLKGVKLHPDIQQFPADDKRIMPVYEFCEAKGLPVLVHTGDYRYDYSNPDKIVRILRRFPNLKFIGAHLGGWSVWDEAVKKLSDFENISVDTCSSLYYLGKEKAEEFIKIWGEDRVMFGTDYPLWHQKPEIDTILSMEFSGTTYEKIFRDNCVRIFDFASALPLIKTEDESEAVIYSHPRSVEGYNHRRD